MDNYIWILVLLVCVPVALWLNKNFQLNNPDKHPYRWGYYCSASLLLALLYLPIEQLGLMIIDASFIGFIEATFFIALTILPLLIIIWLAQALYKRKKSGWVGLTLLGLLVVLTDFPTSTSTAFDIIVWLTDIVVVVINILYARNRWHEFSLREDKS